jgi:zinc transport system permease protein
LSALLGVQVVQYRLAFFSDTVSHSAFTGVALGLLLHIDPYWAVLGFAVLTALAMTWLSRRQAMHGPHETIVGVVQSAVVALGVFMVSQMNELAHEFDALLYGDILSISSTEIFLLAALLAVTVAYQWRFFNQLLLISLHRELAMANGLRARAITTCNQLLIALTVAVGLRAVGILLITALLIVPAAAARNYSRRARSFFYNTLLINALSVSLGFLLALLSDASIGASIIAVAVGFFVISFWTLGRHSS